MAGRLLSGRFGDTRYSARKFTKYTRSRSGSSAPNECRRSSSSPSSARAPAACRSGRPTDYKNHTQEVRPAHATTRSRHPQPRPRRAGAGLQSAPVSRGNKMQVFRVRVPTVRRPAASGRPWIPPEGPASQRTDRGKSVGQEPAFNPRLPHDSLRQNAEPTRTFDARRVVTASPSSPAPTLPGETSWPQLLGQDERRRRRRPGPVVSEEGGHRAKAGRATSA